MEDQIRNQLKQAAAMLPGYHDNLMVLPVPISGPLVGNWIEFQMFYNESEYELAWDTLESMGKRFNAPLNFWLHLSEIADLMNLSDHALRARIAAEGRQK